jgi:hypothetical protein
MTTFGSSDKPRPAAADLFSEGNTTMTARPTSHLFDATPLPKAASSRSIPLALFVAVGDAIQDLGCSRSLAYEHLRRAASRTPGKRGFLPVPLSLWERSTKERLPCASSDILKTTIRPSVSASPSGTTRTMPLLPALDRCPRQDRRRGHRPAEETRTHDCARDSPERHPRRLPRARQPRSGLRGHGRHPRDQEVGTARRTGSRGTPTMRANGEGARVVASAHACRAMPHPRNPGVAALLPYPHFRSSTPRPHARSHLLRVSPIGVRQIRATADAGIPVGTLALEATPSRPVATVDLGPLEARPANLMLGPRRGAGRTAPVTAAERPAGAGRTAQRNHHARSSTPTISEGIPCLCFDRRKSAIGDGEALGAEWMSPPREAQRRVRSAATVSCPSQAGGPNG